MRSTIGPATAKSTAVGVAVGATGDRPGPWQGPQPPLIELDVTGFPDGRPAPAPAPRRPAGFATVAVTLLLAVSTLSAAAAPPPRLLAPVRLTVAAGTLLGSADRNDFRLETPAVAMVGAATVYVLDTARLLRAFDAATGRRSWERMLPGAATALLEAGAVTLAVAVDGDGLTTTALDHATGAVRWHREGQPVWIAPDHTRVVLQPRSMTADAVQAEPLTLTAVGAADGRTIWEYVGVPTPAGEIGWVAGSEAGLQVTAGVEVQSETGLPQVLDFASGQLRTLPDGRHDRVTLVGDLLVVGDDSGGSLRGYDRDTLRPRWATTGIATSWQEGVRCGHLICLIAQDGTVAVDPASGAVRWRSGWWAVDTDRGHVLALRQGSGDPRGSVAVLDAGTGAMLRRLQDWRFLVPDRLGTGMPVARRGLAPGVQLAVFDLDRLVLVPVARGSTGFDSCVAGRVLVACLREARTLSVWRYQR